MAGAGRRRRAPSSRRRCCPRRRHLHQHAGASTPAPAPPPAAHLAALARLAPLQLGQLALGQLHHVRREVRRLGHVDAERLVAGACLYVVEHGQAPAGGVDVRVHVQVAHAHGAAQLGELVEVGGKQRGRADDLRRRRVCGVGWRRAWGGGGRGAWEECRTEVEVACSALRPRLARRSAQGAARSAQGAGRRARQGVHLHEVLGDGPGQAEAVVGGGAAAQLVDDDQRALRGALEDGGGLRRGGWGGWVGGGAAWWAQRPAGHVLLGRTRRA